MNSMVLSKQDVLARIAGARETLHAMGVARLGLFGSFSRATPTAESDVDFLVEFKTGRLSFDSYMDVHFYLEDLLGRRIELVTPQSLNRHTGPHILREVVDVLDAA
jgi:predicted nucleotidyltransferase